MGHHALPAHTHERLIADTHLSAIATGALPNDGVPLDGARVALEGGRGAEAASPMLDVGVCVGDARFHKRFGRESVANDAQVLVSQLSQTGTIPTGFYHYSLVEAPPGDGFLPDRACAPQTGSGWRAAW